MKSNFDNNVYNFLIYFLITTLILICLYCGLNYLKYQKTYKLPQGNAIDVSPTTGESVQPVISRDHVFQIRYPEGTSASMFVENQGDIIYEKYDESIKDSFYKAVFFNETTNFLDVAGTITPIPIEELTPLKFFSNSREVPIYYKGRAELVFVEFAPGSSTSFIYNEGSYEYMEDNNDSPRPRVSNIILQFVKKDYNTTNNEAGNAIICSGGKSASVKWTSESNGRVNLKDYHGQDVSILKGKSWWIILEEGTTAIIN